MGVHIWGQRDGNPPDPNLVAQLLAFCGNPGNSFTLPGVAGTLSCTPSTVSGTASISARRRQGFDDLPFNAVNNNALLQPDYQIDEFNSIYHGLQTS